MLNKTLSQDDKIFKALNLVTINRLICTTDKGVLSLQIRKGETNYHLCLDSVPLDKALNTELMELLFPIPKMEVPQVNKRPLTWNGQPVEPNSKEAKILEAVNPAKVILVPKKKGRPAKAK